MRKIFFKTLLLLTILAVFAGILPTTNAVEIYAANDYYSSITATGGTQLLGQLHDLITTTHTKYLNYSGDLVASNYYKSEPGSNSSSLMEFYTQQDIAKNNFNTSGGWNREHVWPQSLSNNLWGKTGGGSDMHHIRPTECGINSDRGNKLYGEVSGNRENYAADVTGISEIGGYINGCFEPIDSVKGDVARIILYVYVHYNTYSNTNVFGGYATTNGKGNSSYFGTLNFSNVMKGSESEAIQTLLKWNKNDPVDDIERTRNEAVYQIQGNRNPFIDNSSYADAIWGNGSVDVNPDAELKSLTVSSSSLTLSVGENSSLGVWATPSDASAEVTWSSSNNSVATVSSSGYVSAVGEGTATITATSLTNAGITASCVVTVNKATVLIPADMENLQENTAYKLAVVQENLSKTLYIKNEIESKYYLASTEDATQSDDVFLQKTDDGFYLYFLNGDTKNYLNAVVSDSFINLKSQNTAVSVWQYDSENSCIKTSVTVQGENTFAYIGTYNYYSTFSTSDISHISTSFCAYLVTTEDSSEPIDPSETAEDFASAVAEIDNAADITTKFEAIKNSVTVYKNLSDDQKALAAEDYAKLSQAVEDYNTEISRRNEQSTKNLQNLFGASASAAVVTLLAILKRIA